MEKEKDVIKLTQGLVNVLLDKTAREDERDDAAMDLGSFNNDYAITALLEVGSDPNDNDTVVNSCGESLAWIWLESNTFDVFAYNQLAPYAKHAAFSIISAKKPEWIGKYRLHS